MGFKTYTCPIAKACGGCEWLAVPYPIQLRRKQKEVEKLFSAAAERDHATIEPIRGMEDPRAFRNKAATPFAPGKGGRIRSGFFAAGSHRIVRCDSCLVEDPRARDILNDVARVAERLGIRAYQEDRGRGTLRHAIVRCGYATEDILLTLGQVGCPACGGNLDLFHAMGIEKVMFCGGGGVLDRNIEVGQVLVVDGAIRDEGFSYQYLPPSRIVYTDPQVTDRIVSCLEKRDVPYLRGLVWTTDAIFRETADRIALRKEEGAKIVEMEQAACIAVARFRNFAYGALIYGGDDLTGEDWDGRSWRSREGVRYDLVRLCSDLVREI